MENIRTVFAFLLVLSCLGANAQFKSKEEIELGKTLKKLYPDDEVCALLSTDLFTFDIGRNDTVTAMQTAEEEFVGLKDRSSVTVVESYNHFSSVDFIRTFYKEGKKYTVNSFQSIIDKPYFQSAVFDDDNRYKAFTLDFSTLGEGAKYEMRTNYSDIKYLTTAYFHSGNPVEEKKLVFEIPDWFQLELKEFNFEGFEIKKTSVHNDKRKMTIITYTLSHCVARKQEVDAPGYAFVWPHVVLVPQKFTNKKGVTQTIFNSTDDLYNWYAYLVSKTNNNKTELGAQVKILTEGKTTDIEKIKAIYYWVQDKVRYIAFEAGLAGFIPEDCGKVYSSKYGDCKGMANLLTNMLQVAGFDARLTWIGTKDIPYDYSLPSLIVDNHMICTVFLKDSIYFLDGTEDFIAFGDYAYRIQARPAMIQDGKKYVIKNVPDLPKERNKKETKRSFTLKDQLLVGKGTTIFNGESQTNILRAYAFEESDKKEELLQRIISGYSKNFSISNVKTSATDDREKPLRFDYDFTMANQVTDAAGETYVSIDFSRDFEDMMPDDKRQNGYILDEKIYRTYTAEFEVPKGYTVKYIPEALLINKPDYKMNVSYKKEGNKIVLQKTVSIDNGIIKKSIFPEWKKDLKQLKQISAEQLVLTPQTENTKTK